MNEPAKKTQPRLGKGLSALMGEVESVGPVATQAVTDPATPGAAELPIANIRPNPSQPRRTFGEEELKELSASIKARGVLQAILVRPDPKDEGKYQIVAGERRWRAAKLAGLSAIPVIVRDMDELELLEIGIIENVQRSDLNPIEEAEAYEALMKRFGKTQEGLATSVGKSRVHITNTLRLLQLPEGAREYLRDGAITAGHARAALGSPDPEALLDQVVRKKLSVRDVEALAKTAKRLESPIETKSATAKPEKDVDTEALEADLTRTLGLTVDIRHGARGGELRIKYRDLEQLDDVCRRLTAKRGN